MLDWFMHASKGDPIVKLFKLIFAPASTKIYIYLLPFVQHAAKIKGLGPYSGNKLTSAPASISIGIKCSYSL